MIITKTVLVKISSSNISYWRGLGYDFEYKHPRWNNGETTMIEVDVSHLTTGSSMRVDCQCGNCKKIYSLEYKIARVSMECEACIKRKLLLGNTYGSKNKGKTITKMQGKNHPRFNPKKKEYQTYRNRVQWLSSKQDLSNLENFDKTRGLAGVSGAYQLDHIFSIQDGFINKIPPEMLADIRNLQIISWEENNKKRNKSVITLKEFLQKFL